MYGFAHLSDELLSNVKKTACFTPLQNSKLEFPFPKVTSNAISTFRFIRRNLHKISAQTHTTATLAKPKLHVWHECVSGYPFHRQLSWWETQNCQTFYIGTLQTALYGALTHYLIVSHLIVSVSLSEFLILCLVFLLYHTKAVLSTTIRNRCGWGSPWFPNLFWIVTYHVPKLNVCGSSATGQLKEVTSAVIN